MPWDNHFDNYDDEDDFVDPIVLMGQLKHETGKAYLFICRDGSEHWFPKTQATLLHDGALQVTNWIMEQKGLDEDICNRPPAQLDHIPVKGTL